MSTDDVGWWEGNRLVAELGGERHLAARVLQERAARGWSQSELSRQMADVGCPIPQTAISRIEAGLQDEARRDITVDEAIAFARVFAIPFAELLMPPEQFESMAQARLLQDAGRARRDYIEAIDELAVAAAKDPPSLQRLIQYAAGKPISIPRFASPGDRGTDLDPVISDVVARVETIRSRALERRAPRKPR